MGQLQYSSAALSGCLMAAMVLHYSQSPAKLRYIVVGIGI